MSTIKQLENELNKKTVELYETSNALRVLYAKLVSSTKTLKEIKDSLNLLKASLQDLHENNYDLMKENQQLKSSCDEWMKRAIKLEFKVLSERDAAKK